MGARTEVDLDFTEPVKGKIISQLTAEHYRGRDKTMATAVFFGSASSALRQIADWMDKHDDITVTEILVQL